MGENIIYVNDRDEFMTAVARCGLGDVIKIRNTNFEFRPNGKLWNIPIRSVRTGEPLKSGATIASQLIARIKRTPKKIWQAPFNHT